MFNLHLFALLVASFAWSVSIAFGPTVETALVDGRSLWHIFKFFYEMARTLKTFSCVDQNVNVFQVCSKPFPETVFRGPQCQTVIKHLFLAPFTIFWVSKKTSFANHFRSQMFQRSMRPNSWEWPFCDPAFHETMVITVSLDIVFF
jgi:hypothetical protein